MTDWFLASVYGALGGAGGGMLGVSVMLAAQLGYYQTKKNGMTPSYSTTTLQGQQIRLIPPGKKVKEVAIVKAVTPEFVVVEYEDQRLGTQEIPRLYFDTRSEAERKKGQDWYEVKRRAVCGKCVQHEAEGCFTGCTVGTGVALCDEALMQGQVHPCAVTPDAAIVGCILAGACQGGRICWKSRKHARAKEERKKRAEEQARQRDKENQERQGQGFQPPVQGIVVGGETQHAEVYQGEYEYSAPMPEYSPYPATALGNPYATAYDANPYGKQVVYPDDAPQYPTRGSRGVGSNVSGGSRSRLSTGPTPSRVARGVAAADHSLAGDAEMSGYWEEKQRRQRIQRLLDQGGDPTAEEHRSLFDRHSAYETEGSHVSNRQTNRKSRSVVSSETADLVSLRGSQVGASSVAYNSQDEYATRSPGLSATSQSRVRAPGPTTRLGVRSSAGW